jgi:predicted alpha/beta-hydrolase family hydrolase
MAVELGFEVDRDPRVSALVCEPPDARVAFVFALGAGAGMAHPFMAAVAEGLAARGVASLRFQFPATERGSKRPDPPRVAHAAVRAAVAEAGRRWPGVALVAGGKSFGGRMTSQAQAAAPLPGVVALAFVGFPLHPAGQPGTERAAHLADVRVPMLFVQGTNDALAAFELIEGVTRGLGERATLHRVEHADHSFHVPVRSGRTDAQVLDEILDAMARWMLLQAA